MDEEDGHSLLFILITLVYMITLELENNKTCISSQLIL